MGATPLPQLSPSGHPNSGDMVKAKGSLPSSDPAPQCPLSISRINRHCLFCPQAARARLGPSRTLKQPLHLCSCPTSPGALAHTCRLPPEAARATPSFHQRRLGVGTPVPAHRRVTGCRKGAVMFSPPTMTTDGSSGQRRGREAQSGSGGVQWAPRNLLNAWVVREWPCGADL